MRDRFSKIRRKRIAFAKVLSECNVSDRRSLSLVKVLVIIQTTIISIMSSAEIPPQLAKIVARFQRRTDPKQKYKQLLWYAQKLPPMSEAGKTEANKVKGCVSQVYITASLEDGKVQYQGDSDAQLVKGLVAFLIEGLNNLPPTEIVQVEPSFIEDTGLQVSLTPSRANGFFNILQMMKQKAQELMPSSE